MEEEQITQVVLVQTEEVLGVLIIQVALELHLLLMVGQVMVAMMGVLAGAVQELMVQQAAVELMRLVVFQMAVHLAELEEQEDK
tara:strand:- start:299 stop:550 length:252 start_codon:yes stop_codon:yes gene_type:complete